MSDSQVKTNSLKAWILAARPKTLSGAAVPVMIGTVIAWAETTTNHFQVIPAILCFLFAFIMQIDSNFINDYFDCIKGNDDVETRLGPKRACSEGWITLPKMRMGLIITSLLGCLTGLPLVIYGGWTMIIVGVLCVLFAFLYTTKLSYLGLGDILVLVFFGIVPVYFTYWVIVPQEMQIFNLRLLFAGIACGVVIDTLLIINNYRDRDNDKRDGKNTLVVRLGTTASELLYQSLGFTGAIIILCTTLFKPTSSHTILDYVIALLLTSIYIFFHVTTYRTMKKIKQGRELNKVLGLTARNMFFFGITSVITILLFW
jgi:1,4-dihydroxy-2-naphthoate octaprenyltransferase